MFRYLGAIAGCWACVAFGARVVTSRGIERIFWGSYRRKFGVLGCAESSSLFSNLSMEEAGNKGASLAPGAHDNKTVKKESSKMEEKLKSPADTGNEEMDATQYFENRMAAVRADEAKNISIYPHKFKVDMSIEDFREKYAHLASGEHVADEPVRLAGRIMRLSASSQKLRFYDLHGDGVKVQVMSSLSFHDAATGDFLESHNRLRRGDIVGVRGFPGKSKRGELSIFSNEISVLSPCYHMLPDKSGLKNVETRYRKRFLDLIINENTRKIFIKRTNIIRTLRNFLEDEGFLEVETRILNKLAGGAAAKPFATFHNELKSEMFLRVAPELPLKMLVIGGLNKVFEIGKNFRNEGIDLTHNPEFTSAEFYWAYADFYDLMDFTEKLLSHIVLKVLGTLQVPFHPNGPEGPEVILDFTPPYRRLSLVEEIERCCNTVLPRPLDGQESVNLMLKLIEEHHLEKPYPATPAKLLDQLSSHFVESQVKNQPAFITEYPQVMSPLAKWHRGKEELTERFELFLFGKELCNAYTELNDPRRQRECFMEQAKAKLMGDDEANVFDEEFCNALEYGLPPTAGWGMGIDRLTMFLTDNINIKEVLLFPAVRNLPALPATSATHTDSEPPASTASS